MPRWLLFLVALSLPLGAHGGDFDIDANQFYIIDGATLRADESNFQKVMAEIGVATGPKLIGPAKTLGILGFDIGYALNLTNINESSTHWKKVSESASNYLPTMQVNFSKGLPFSFELSGLITHMFQSEVWGVGLNLKWALVEGYKYFPEIMISSNVGTLMGTGDYTLLTFGGSFLVSKSFGIGGILALAPYAGYHSLAGRGASEVLYHFVGDEQKTFVINPFFFVRHFGVVGVSVKGGLVAFSAETMLSGDIQSFGFKGSLNF